MNGREIKNRMRASVSVHGTRKINENNATDRSFKIVKYFCCKAFMMFAFNVLVLNAANLRTVHYSWLWHKLELNPLKIKLNSSTFAGKTCARERVSSRTNSTTINPMKSYKMFETNVENNTIEAHWTLRFYDK